MKVLEQLSLEHKQKPSVPHSGPQANVLSLRVNAGEEEIIN